MLAHKRQILSAWLFAIVLSAGCIEGRRLRGYDAWASAPACSFAVTWSNGNKDNSGRLWGWDATKGASCAFKDEQQQALYPNTVTPLQVFSTAPACGDAPNAFNSAPDSAGRLWGVWWGKSCAFRTAAGEPIYYTGYSGKRYTTPATPSPSTSVPPSPSQPAPAPSTPATPTPAVKTPSPSPTPRPTVPVTPSPSPNIAVKPAGPSPAVVQPSPMPVLTTTPAPAASNSCGGTAPPVTVLLNSTAVAVAVADALYIRLSDATNGYEGSAITIAEGPSSGKTSATQASPPPEPTRLSDNPYVMDYLNGAASKLNTTSRRHLAEKTGKEYRSGQHSQVYHHQRHVQPIP